MNVIDQFFTELEPLLQRLAKSKKQVNLVVASKYFNIEQIRKLYGMGQRDFGENRIQDVLEKIPQLPSDIRWHFIGHLQKNKINKAIDLFYLIHSVDSIELAQKISERSSHPQKILLQVNTSLEESKNGFSIEDCQKAIPIISQFSNIEICGLMTMAPFEASKDKIRETFAKLSQIKDSLGKKHWHLSMGMSQDYEIAIEEGADIVRIGRRFLDLK